MFSLTKVVGYIIPGMNLGNWVSATAEARASLEISAQKNVAHTDETHQPEPIAEASSSSTHTPLSSLPSVPSETNIVTPKSEPESSSVAGNETVTTRSVDLPSDIPQSPPHDVKLSRSASRSPVQETIEKGSDSEELSSSFEHVRLSKSTLMLRGSTIPLGLRTPVRLPLPSSPATDSPASLPSSSQSPKYDNRIVTPRMFPRDSDAYYPSDVETQHSSAPHSERNAPRVPPTPSDLSGFSDAEQFGGSGYGTLSDAEMEPSDVEGDHRGHQALDLEEINNGSVPRPGWIFGGSPGHSHEALNETVHGTVVHQTGSVKLDSPIRTIQEPFPSVDQVAAEMRSPKGTPVSPGSSPSPRRPATSSGSLQGSGLKEDNMKTFVYSPGSPPSIKQDTSSPRALASPRSVLLSPSSPRPRTISSSMQQGSASNSPRTLSASLQASLTSARGGSPGSIKAGTPRSPPKPLGIPQSPAPRDHVLGESRLRSSSRSTTDLRSANVTSGRPRESSRSPSAGISVDLPEWASDGSPASEGGLSPGRTSRSRKLSSPMMNGSLSSRVPSSPVRPAYHDQSPYQSPLASPTANPQQLSADDSVVITSEVNAGSSTAVQSPPRNTASIALERSFSMGYDNVAIEANPTPKQQRSEDPLASKFKSLLNNQEAAQMALVQAMTSGRNQSMVSARMALVTARDQLRMFRDMHPEYKDRTE